MLKLIQINLSFLWNSSIKWTGRIFALIGLICTFASPSELFSKSASIWIRILLSAVILLSVWISTFLASFFYTLVIHRRKILELNGGYHVYLQYGDLFSANEVIEPNSRRNIVIPVNRCFDTVVDDKLISSNSLHGKAFKNIYASTRLTPQTLNAKIFDSLMKNHAPFEELDRHEKPEGNLKRFSVGTVTELSVIPNVTYFLLGLSTFDNTLTAHTSDDDYVLCLSRLIDYCGLHSQQYPIVMPLIGTGLSKTQKSEKIVLEYIIKLLQMNKNKLHCDIHIIVRSKQKNSISIFDV